MNEILDTQHLSFSFCLSFSLASFLWFLKLVLAGKMVLGVAIHVDVGEDSEVGGAIFAHMIRWVARLGKAVVHSLLLKH